MLAAAQRRERRDAQNKLGKYVVEARRKVPGVDMDWRLVEYVLPGRIESTYGTRKGAEHLLHRLESESLHVTSGDFEVRMRVVRREAGDEAPEPLAAPEPPPPPLPPKGQPLELGERGAPKLSDLMRAARGVPTEPARPLAPLHDSHPGPCDLDAQAAADAALEELEGDRGE